MTDFDPYQQWLGIPPEEQPPDHYRLLGLRRFESDPQTIRAATDERMARIRVYQIGPRAPYTQQLLNKLAAAKLCLLDPYSKSEYDASLAIEAGEAHHLASELPPQAAAESAFPTTTVELPTIANSRAAGATSLAQTPPIRASTPPHHLPGPAKEYDPLFLGWWLPLLIVIGTLVVGLGFWATKVVIHRQRTGGPLVADSAPGKDELPANGGPVRSDAVAEDTDLIVQEESGFLVFSLDQARLQGQVGLDVRSIGSFLVGWRSDDDVASWRFVVRNLPPLGSFRVYVEYQASPGAEGARYALVSEGEELLREIRGLNRIVSDEFYLAVKRTGESSLEFSLRDFPRDATFALKRIEFSIPTRGATP